MKLSSETLTVLQNFSKLNSGIEFKQGNTIKTMSVGKTVLAKATLKDSFPHDFCVYDLNKFLGMYNLFKDTNLDFDDKNVYFVSADGRKKTDYRKSSREVIVVPPEKELTLPSVDVVFTLTQDDFNSILKAAAQLQSPHIKVESDGEKVSIVASDESNDSAHTSSIEVGAGDGKKYKMVFLTDNLRLIDGSYDVEISFKGLAFFKNKNQDIQYWVATESKYSKSGE